jgi:hypothetical protein
MAAAAAAWQIIIHYRLAAPAAVAEAEAQSMVVLYFHQVL